MSRIGDWGERAYIHVYRRGLASRLLDQLASHPGNFDNLQELMDITLESYKRYHESNEFSTAVNNVSLVGELENPSLSSFHTPFIIPSQSSLPSRDEVCTEIKDVGEDVGISSLHLFQGDMDLPTLSFHVSLEEVKAEELPLHHTSAHHIELEGVLPPVSVTYSLSNHESETLQAYISEDLEKFFIRPSMSSTGSPVLFVKQNDGGLHLCVD
ncbi:hypothetical protein O181_070969 [Austropuccinia psidii MF-1]|uniref:Uncharacterized protein n=1 Tax=Austropuccinia psidii MF-1 TaxID=1389203 RepID=A0A9Q3F1V9_9BASI|nr:hypothetical protein [Austropuccinia psidii MF-1]